MDTIKPNINGLDDLLIPKLKIFLSVDVINSTQYKNKQIPHGQVQPWLQFFEGFFTYFPAQLNKNCQRFRKTADFKGKDYKDLEMWKTSGDEIIFQTTLRDPEHALFCILAFTETIKEYNAFIREEIEAGVKLQVKGTAWLAGFPVGNARIFNEFLRKEDYIGPLIDIGFRLTQFAKRNFLVVSVELACVLSLKTHRLKYFFLGKQRLKGVSNLEGKSIDYPIIAIGLYHEQDDGNDELERFEKKHSLLPIALDEMQQYCEATIKKVGRPLMKPFIAGKPPLDEKPQYYDEELHQIRIMLEDLYKDKRNSVVEEAEIPEQQRPRMTDERTNRKLFEKIKKIPKDTK